MCRPGYELIPLSTFNCKGKPAMHGLFQNNYRCKLLRKISEMIIIASLRLCGINVVIMIFQIHGVLSTFHRFYLIVQHSDSQILFSVKKLAYYFI